MAGRRNRKRQRGGHETPEQAIGRVAIAFLHWLDDHPSGTLRADDLLLAVTQLAHIKAALGVTNPADWPAETIDEIAAVIAEQPHLDPDGDLARHGAAALSIFVDFLVETGRWKPHNDERASRAAIDRARSAALAAPDPTGPVDRLPVQWSTRLSGTDGAGGADGAGADHRLDVGDADDFDEWEDDLAATADDLDPADPGLLADAAALFVQATGLGPGDVVPVAVPPVEEEWAALSGTPLLHHLRALVAWIGPGRKLTGGGLLTPRDLTWWVGQHELPVPETDRDVTEAFALVDAWNAAVDGEVISVRGRRAVRGPRADLLDGPATPERVLLGRALVDLVISDVLVRTADPTATEIAAYAATLPVLVTLCSERGQDLAVLPPEPIGDLADDATEDEETQALLSVLVFDKLRLLQAFGLVPAGTGPVAIPVGLRPAVVASINAPSAPFRIDAEPGAVPLQDPVD